jgi:hypothetical protein
LWSACETDAQGDSNELGGTGAEPTPGGRSSMTPVPKQTEIADDASSGTECDPAYPDLCVPPPPPDLDCSYVYDRSHDHITVLSPDPHNLDGNRDGVACEGG